MKLAFHILAFFVCIHLCADEKEGVTYSDPEYCANCHDYFYRRSMEGKGAHHFYANKKLSARVDGFEFGGIECDPEMSIGIEPLVQYVVNGERGAKQVGKSAQDTRWNEWFNVFGGEVRTAGEWGHESGRGMTWNTNCAFCHMTGFKKNYDSQTDAYESRWLRQGVTCLQCHSVLSEKCGVKELPVGKMKLRDRKTEMYACASCHSRREELTANKFKSGEDYFDHFNPILPDSSGVYYPDGQIREENFMFVSFMMCRQFDAGITCADCHDSHSLETFRPSEDNSLCMSCHIASARNIKGAPTIIPNEHSHHKNDPGNSCVECHMPKTIFMQRDARRDHGLISPDPYLTKHAGTPNACTNCHAKLGDEYGRDIDKMLLEFNSRHDNPRFLRKRERAIAVHRSYKGELGHEHMGSLLKLAKSESNAAWRSTLILLLSPYAQSPEVAIMLNEGLKDQSPLVRSASVRSLSGLANLAANHNDGSRLVRIFAAFGSNKSSLDKKNIAELEEYLDFNSDTPLGALKRADFALRNGEYESAAESARHALNLDKSNPELARQAAIMLFRAKDTEGALGMLKDASDSHPDDPQLHYALGLLYAELSDFEMAEGHMILAVKHDGMFARAWYNLSLIQSRLGKGDAAASMRKAALIDAAYGRFVK